VGVLTTPDSQVPISADVGNGPSDLSAVLLNGSAGHLVTGDAGAAGGTPLTEAGILTNPDSQAPLGADVGDGQNIATVNVLGHSDALQGLTGSLTGINGSTGSGDHLATGAAGAPGGSPIADAGVLTTPDSQSPVGAEVSNVPNQAAVSVLDGAMNHLITGAAGTPGGSPVADAGLLTMPDAQTPVGAEVGNGQNIVAANLLSHSDALSFPDLGGTGSDALTGLVSPGADPGHLVSSDTPATGDVSLVDLHTDGAPIVQLHDGATSVAGLNNHAIV
jgi:hypothetical protein